MAEQMDKAKILDEMRTKYAALEGILAPLEETQMTKRISLGHSMMS
jgi:hypothetical protein